jgi:hypothetical protein
MLFAAKTSQPIKTGQREDWQMQRLLHKNINTTTTLE